MKTIAEIIDEDVTLEQDIGGVGFTGTQRGMTGDQAATVMRWLVKLRKSDKTKFRQGCCVGADEQTTQLANAIGYFIVGYPGTIVDKTSRICFALCDDFVEVEPVGNINRNHAIVDDSGVMIAAPFGGKELTRSGTWATIRYAKKQQKPMIVVWPDGSYDMMNMSEDDDE